MKFKVLLFLLAGSIGAGAQTTPVYLDESKPIEARIDDALSRMTLQEKIAVIHAQSKFSSPGVKRLGIPEYWTSDGPHGVRPETMWDAWDQAGQSNDSVVAFPALTCLAATWNPEVAAEYGKAVGEEALYRKKNMMLGPGVNIYRTPLNGRNFEYMGEDPYLASRMAVPYIKGIQSNYVSACIKHFCLNNNEINRHTTNVIISERALNEIYLPAFKAAVEEAHTWGIMGSYNLWKNHHNCHNPYLLNDILKKQWNYDGVVVSDWGGAHDTDESIKYGLDMEFGTHTDGMSMNVANGYEKYHLAKAYRDGIIAGKYSQDELNDKVRRVLRLFFRTSMKRDKGFGSLCSEAHYATARKIGEEGVVLLQNNNILPIDIEKTHKILVVGENAIKMMTIGGGSSKLKAQDEYSPLEGIRARFGKTATIDYARGYTSITNTGGGIIAEQTKVIKGVNMKEKRSNDELRQEAVEKARNADIVLVFGGLNKHRYQDTENYDRKDYEMPYNQNELVEALLAVNKNIVFVNISGNSMAMPWAKKVPAILQAWYLGSETGRIIGGILAGDVNPSGKLPYTWGQKLTDYGAHALNTYPGIKRANEEIYDEEYKEGIYVGYRWIDKEKIKPLFSFGHGLSYTTFKIGKVSADKKEVSQDGQITFTVNVQNTGKRAGAEVVQLYISDLKASVDRPAKELKGFKKVYLQPGESKDVSISIRKDALSFYDETIHSWKAEAGEFEALVGNAADNICSKVKFTLR